MSFAMITVYHINALCLILASTYKQLEGNLRFRNHQLQYIFSSVPEARELFVFSDSGPKPFSPQLEAALDQLTFAGFIHRFDAQNPDIVVISSFWLAYAEEIPKYKALSEEDIVKVRKVADHLVINLR